MNSLGKKSSVLNSYSARLTFIKYNFSLYLRFSNLSLDDLNVTHQHCVLAGLSPRFSSTHRVADVSIKNIPLFGPS